MSETLINKTQTGEGLWTSDNLIAGKDISITEVQQPVIDENTLGVWHFDGNYDNAVSGSSFPAIVPNSPSYTSHTGNLSDFDKYMSITGGDRKFLSSNYDLSGSNFTIDLWINVGSISDRYLFYSTDTNKGSFRFESGNVLCFCGSWTNLATKTISLEANSWHHFAIERYGAAANFYVDGEFMGTGSNVGSQLSYLTLSANAGCSYDEMRISNVARYQGQDFTPPQQLYAATLGEPKYQINNTKADPDLSSYLKNTATGTGSLTVGGGSTTATSSGTTNVGLGTSTALGNRATSYGFNAISNGQYTTSLGADSQAASGSSTAIGYGAQANASGDISIGFAASSYNGTNAIAIGYNAKATATNAIQLSTGTNSTANTFQVFNYQLLDANGKVPVDRLPATSSTSLHWFKNNTGTTLDTQLSTLTENSKVFKNGLLLELTTNDFDAEVNDYTISGTTITFTDALVASDKICVEC